MRRSFVLGTKPYDVDSIVLLIAGVITSIMMPLFNLFVMLAYVYYASEANSHYSRLVHPGTHVSPTVVFLWSMFSMILALYFFALGIIVCWKRNTVVTLLRNSLFVSIAQALVSLSLVIIAGYNSLIGTILVFVVPLVVPIGVYLMTMVEGDNGGYYTYSHAEKMRDQQVVQRKHRTESEDKVREMMRDLYNED